MATEEGDRVLDPFGGAGTTYAAAEVMDREWVGAEIHDCTPIIQRFEEGLEDDREHIQDIEEDLNVLFTQEALEKRMKYKDEFTFNFEDYDLSESMDGFQKSLDSY
jgi:site-specific DNA-methyltransferase (adenine-specific)